MLVAIMVIRPEAKSASRRRGQNQARKVRGFSMNHVQKGAGVLSAIASRETALASLPETTGASEALLSRATSVLSEEASPFWFGTNTTTIAFMPNAHAARRATVN
jgi:hypothetical protein